MALESAMELVLVLATGLASATGLVMAMELVLALATASVSVSVMVMVMVLALALATALATALVAVSVMTIGSVTPTMSKSAVEMPTGVVTRRPTLRALLSATTMPWQRIRLWRPGSEKNSVYPKHCWLRTG
jgi:hypothetical protein